MFHMELRRGTTKSQDQQNKGPTLLFRRHGNTEKCVQSFYACSACRDRRDCNFYLKSGEKLSQAAMTDYEKRRQQLIPAVCFKTLHQEWMGVSRHSKGPSSIYFCHSCSRFVNEATVNLQHKEHQVESNITADQLMHPTKLLRPLQNSSKEAQFHFSNNTIKFIENALYSLRGTTVIAIGTPSLLEYLKTGNNSPLNVMLLDLDWRYSMFFGSRFCWYNMFNHHFMASKDDSQGKKSRKAFTKLLINASKGESYVVVMDPPFGGRVEALANTVRQIAGEIRQLGRTENVYYLWIYPYFMEPYINAELPGTRMLDYKVTYVNHSKYQTESRLCKKQGSPVRIFTNSPLKLIPMPEEEGYKMCNICQHYVSNENKHCFKCNACTSKNGKTYIHCDICKRCVKPTWKHCSLCQRCCLPNHGVH